MARRLSILALARNARVHASYLNRLEHGKLKRDPSEQKLRQVEEALGVDPGTLVVVAGSGPTVTLQRVWANANHEKRKDVWKFLTGATQEQSSTK